MTPHPSVTCYDRSPSFCSKYIDVSDIQVFFYTFTKYYFTLYFHCRRMARITSVTGLARAIVRRHAACVRA